LNGGDVNAVLPPSPRTSRVTIRLRQIVAEIKTCAAASDGLTARASLALQVQ
jgi:hypothetical protein